MLSHFQAQRSEDALTKRAQAGLCLRCRISYPILQACKRFGNVYSSNPQFTYYDLLPFVLNDDGRDLIILGQDGQTHLKLDHSGIPQSVTFKLFTVEVLRTFKADSPTSMSLDNWAFLRTRQQPDLKNFLSEVGCQHLTDWALLNRVRPKQLEQLSERDRHLVEAFHAVYRRDRRQQQKGSCRCLDPNDSQLAEMVDLLQQRGIYLKTHELMQALRQVAKQLRQCDIWQSREPLEIQNEDGGYDMRFDLPASALSELDAEEQKFLELLRYQLSIALAQSLETAIQTQITYLEKSKRYAPFASYLIPGLKLYYCEGLSLKEIGPQLGMSSWDQTRRILNPGELLNNVRRLMVQQLFEPILEKAKSKGFTSMPPELSYIKTLTEQIEAFVDAEIFEEAASEIKAGKNRSLDSVYAQQLKHYVKQNA